jgi:uncharacterized protein (TIGR02118 family)
MGEARIIALYPRPTDIEAFEKVYWKEHMPLASAKLTGVIRFVATRVLGSPQGTPPYHRIAEIHFPSLAALEACVASAGGRETTAHAIAISSGGPPIFLVAEEEVFTS